MLDFICMVFVRGCEGGVEAGKAWGPSNKNTLFWVLWNTGWKRTFYINIGLQTDPLRDNGVI